LYPAENSAANVTAPLTRLHGGAMETAIVAWEQHLLRSSKLSASTITEYIQDVRRFAAWLRDHERMTPIGDLTLGDA